MLRLSILKSFVFLLSFEFMLTLRVFVCIVNCYYFVFALSLCVMFYARKTTIDADIAKSTTFGLVTTGDFEK